MTRQPVKLAGVEETLLIPVWARAVETKRHDGFIRDETALRLLEEIDYDFSRFKKAWKSQVGVCVRTEIFDEWAARILQLHPDALVVNLGAGLDDRFSRLDNGLFTWIDIDLPKVIELRRHFFTDTDRRRMVAASVLEDSWIPPKEESAGKIVIVIAEGLMMYLDEAQVKDVLHRLITHFPKAHVLMESIGPKMVKHYKIHDSVSGMEAPFRWGCDDPAILERWDPRYKLVTSEMVMQRHRARWRYFSWLMRLAPGFMRSMAGQLIHLRFVSE